MKNRIKSEHRVLLSSKKIVSLMLVFAFCFVVFAQENVKNVIIVNNGENLSAAENSWLPASVKDRFESNLQTYTNFSFITSNDSKIKELQKKFQSGIFDEENAIELGKMTAASHAVLLSTRKAGTVYTITAEFINLTTGKSIAKCVSPSKNKTSELFSDAGCAADLLTIDFCEKIGIKLAGIQIITLKGLDVSDADAIKFYNQEIENYKKQMANLDKEILLLSKSSDLDAASRKAKLESERAIAEQKKKLAEENKIRLANIEKAKIEEAAVNATRTKEQQKKILEVSNESNRKINELKKLKIENLSALGKIRLIETKKRAILDIRKNITEEQNEEKANISKEYEEKILAIKNMPYRTAEKNADGTVAKEVIADRNKKIVTLQEERDTLIKSADKKIEEATIENLANIVTDISLDLEDLQSDFFYANTLNKDLLVRLGNYNRGSDGWELFYSVLCDGMLVEEFKTELKFNEIEKLIPSEMEKYDAIDMYDSLFKCGEPVLTFGLTYTIDISESDFSKYKFIIDELSVYDTKRVTVEKNGAIKGKGFRCGKQNTVLKQMTPAYSLPGIISNNNQSDEFWSSVLELVPEKLYEKETEKIKAEISSKMIAIPEKKISIMSTEVTQGLWKAIMGTNPSNIQNTHDWNFISKLQNQKFNLTEEEIKRINTDNYPVEKMNWEEAIHFCNELSKRLGLEPCYYNEGGWKLYVKNKNGTLKEVSAEVYKKTDKHKYGEYIVSCNFEANGFRLPTYDEWLYAAKGGEKYKYPGSDDLNEVAWFKDNSNYITHPVAQKKANGYGLYDMFGNVAEFMHESMEDIIQPSSFGGRYDMGEGYDLNSYYMNNLYSVPCRVNVNKAVPTIESSYSFYGFRIVCGLNNSGITNAQSEKIINEYNQKLEQEEAERNQKRE